MIANVEFAVAQYFPYYVGRKEKKHHVYFFILSRNLANSYMPS